jgi:hypothetical protein
MSQLSESVQATFFCCSPQKLRIIWRNYFRDIWRRPAHACNPLNAPLGFVE